MPLNINGKVDRKALVAMVQSGDQPASALCLDGVVLCGPADGFIGGGGGLRPMDVEELAPVMGHAGAVADRHEGRSVKR